MYGCIDFVHLGGIPRWGVSSNALQGGGGAAVQGGGSRDVGWDPPEGAGPPIMHDTQRSPCIYINRHTPSGKSRVYRVTQLRTDVVHCRESSGIGPVNPKVVPNECLLPWQVTMDQLTCMRLPLFRTPTINMKWAC